jgi:NADH-quinone oxidoreductase subunit N
MLLLVSSTDFLMILISIEILSVSSFILTGYFKDERRSSEAAMKYFLVGAFSSSLMIYGISLLYGLTGSTGLQGLFDAALKEGPRLPLVGSVLLILAGFGFKLAMVPFHMWVPDTYEGAPTPITAFLSVAPKAAALGILVRAFANHSQLQITWLVALLAALTMTVGNLSALPQTNIKRLLGYSSIAQMGYVLVGFVAAGPSGVGSVLIYALVYMFMNLGVFACAIAVSNEAQTEELDGFSGLAQRSFPLALITTVFLLSLTGLPPVAGFIGKFSIFAAAISEGWIWLSVIGVLNSVISLYYYFGIVRRMFFSDPLVPAKNFSLSPSLAGCVAVTLFVTVVAGIFPNTVLLWVRQIVP